MLQGNDDCRWEWICWFLHDKRNWLKGSLIIFPPMLHDDMICILDFKLSSMHLGVTPQIHLKGLVRKSFGHSPIKKIGKVLYL